MHVSRVATWLAIAAAATACAGTGHAQPVTLSQTVYFSLFPVVVRDPAPAAPYDGQWDTPVYQQTFLPRSAVVLTQDLSVPYLNMVDHGKHEPTVIKAGTVFIEARLANVTAWCRPLAQTHRTFYFPDNDVGACLWGDGDGHVFTHMMTFVTAYGEPHAYAVNQVYNVLLNPKMSQMAISITYDDMPVDDRFASTIRVRQSRATPAGRKAEWEADIDISPELRRYDPAGLEVDKPGKNTSWSGPQPVAWFPVPTPGKGDGSRTKFALPLEASAGPARLAFGDTLAIDFTPQTANSWAVTFAGTLPAGNYMLRQLGNASGRYDDNGRLAFDPAH